MRKTSMALILLATVAASARPADRLGQVDVGRRLPRIAAFDLEQQARSSDHLLAMEKTKGLLVQFWATWCRPCMEEIDQLIRDRKRLADAGVRVLLVNLMEPAEQVERVARRTGAEDFVWIRDRTGAVADVVGIQHDGAGALPVAVVADGSGVVRAILRGGDDHYVEKVLRAIR